MQRAQTRAELLEITSVKLSGAPLSRSRSLSRLLRQQPETIAAVIVALIFGLLLPQLWVGDLLNSYPFMSDDSFDWVTQGVALVDFVTGDDRTPWPVLRPPLFVFVHAADYWLGAGGIVFLISQVSSLAMLSFAVSRFARVRGAGSATSCFAGLAAPLSIVGFYAVWILSDAIASSLMTISAVLVLNRLRAPHPDSLYHGLRSLAPGILVGAAAGITQTYGMIPVLIICSVFAFANLVTRKAFGVWAAPFLAIPITGALGFGLQKLWASIIPHNMQPETFGLLDLSLSMFPFYANVWPLTFGLFVPVVLWTTAVHLQKRLLPSVEVLALMATVGAFAMLSFLYQWPESRMTYIYVPIFILMVVSFRLESLGQSKTATEKRSQGALAATFGAFIFVTLTIVPGDYWRPSVAGLRFAPAETWLLSAFAAKPVDRLRLRVVCEGMEDVCDRAVLSPQSSPYRDLMLSEYKRRRTEGADD